MHLPCLDLLGNPCGPFPCHWVTLPPTDNVSNSDILIDLFNTSCDMPKFRLATSRDSQLCVLYAHQQKVPVPSFFLMLYRLMYTAIKLTYHMWLRPCLNPLWFPDTGPDETIHFLRLRLSYVSRPPFAGTDMHPVGRHIHAANRMGPQI